MPGTTILEQKYYLQNHADGLRQLLLFEPRGNLPSLYADLVVPPVHPQADAGFIIMEEQVYPMVSGTNTMSTAIALLETGRLPLVNGKNLATLEAPGGLIQIEAQGQDGKVTSITYGVQIPSYVAAQNIAVNVPEFGQVSFDVIWSGAFYPLVNAELLGLDMDKNNEAAIVAFCKKFIPLAREAYHPIHPEFGDEGPLSFVVLVSPPEQKAVAQFERKVCCYEYPRHVVCRAPAGVPSTAATLQLVKNGVLHLGDELRTISPFNTDLRVNITEILTYDDKAAIRARVTGQGWITNCSRLVVDLTDPLTPTAGLSDILI